MKIRIITLVSVILWLATSMLSFGQEHETASDPVSEFIYIKWIAAAFAIGCSTIAGGVAVGQIGAAAMAAMSENPEVGAKALPYAALAEGICLWGLGGAVMILIM